MRYEHSGKYTPSLPRCPSCARIMPLTIQHTARYTELSQERFKDFWRRRVVQHSKITRLMSALGQKQSTMP